MGETVKPWLMSVQSEMVELVDQLAQGSGLARPDFMRKILAQGIAVERQLQAEGYRKVTADLTEKSEAQQTSRQQSSTAASEPKASTPHGKPSVQVRPAQKVRKPAKTPRSTGLENVPSALHASIVENRSSSPITSPAATAPSSPASTPATPVEAAVEPPYEISDNPFDAL